MVVQDVVKGRGPADASWHRVVGAKDGAQGGAVRERRADAVEGVAVHEHVGVDEDEDLAVRAHGAVVSCFSGRSALAALADDQLVNSATAAGRIRRSATARAMPASGTASSTEA